MGRHGALVAMCLAFFTDTFVYSSITPFMPHFLKVHYGEDSAHIGLFFASFGLGAVASTFFWSPLIMRVPSDWVILVSSTVGFLAACVFLLPFHLSLPVPTDPLQSDHPLRPAG